MPGWKLAALTTEVMIGTAVTFKVAVIVWEAIPALEIVIAPLYVPTFKSRGFTETEIVEGAVPEVGVIRSHTEFEDADQARVPLPELVILTVSVAGREPPMLKEKFNSDFDNEMTGLAPVDTVKLKVVVAGKTPPKLELVRSACRP
jgi:hypothetical protein